MRCWALPFCSVLAPSERYYQNRGGARQADRPRSPIAVEVKCWVPDRTTVVVADSSLAALKLLGATRRKLRVITRLRLDAALYDPAQQHASGARGRISKQLKRAQFLD
ncbi:hypothetical protein MasN3_03300 [Massilia varians]|uniref:Uncharacterized protein n=2 Tax=Massilia varians TaxID=457921 RepID=A0ABM8C0Y8_9BURK|nr:hypothetical protein MasN3_03300 [Massilia varians]